MTEISSKIRRRNKITGIVLALIAVGFVVSVFGYKLSAH
jgi:high-affinity Fe2+/Pb2+ permease